MACLFPSWQRFSFDEERGIALIDLDQGGIPPVPVLFLCIRDMDIDLDAEWEFDPNPELDPDLELSFVPRDLDSLLSNVESPAVP